MAFHQDLLFYDETAEGNNHFIWTDGAGNVHDELLTLPNYALAVIVFIGPWYFFAHVGCLRIGKLLKLRA